MLEEYVKDNYYTRFHMHVSSRLKVKSQWSVKCRSKAALEYLKNNYYARFHTNGYHCCREMHNNSRLDINFVKVSGL